MKKPRVVWSVEMHQQFVNAVNQLGIDSKSIDTCFDHYTLLACRDLPACCKKAVSPVEADCLLLRALFLAKYNTADTPCL